MVAVLFSFKLVDVTYSNKPANCCRGVQKIVHLERVFDSYLRESETRKAHLDRQGKASKGHLAEKLIP
jgi:hypothetical protein